jgi:hypothetical protein
MAETEALLGYGMEIALFDNELSPPALFTLEEMASCEGPEFTVDSVDATHHASPGKIDENIAGRKRWGQITVMCNFIPGNATHQLLMRLRASGERVRLRKSYPDSPQTHVYFTVWVASLNDATPLEGKLVLTCVFNVSGDIGNQLTPA